MNDLRRQRLLLLLAGLAVGLLVADRLVLTPLAASWKERSARIAELRQSVDQGSLLLERQDAIRDRWQSMRTNTLPWNPSAAESSMLKAFERWAQESRISIASMKPQWNRSDADHMTLEYRADGFGGIESVTRFLYELENDNLAFKVQSMALTTRDKDGGQLSLNLQVSGLLLNAVQP